MLKVIDLSYWKRDINLSSVPFDAMYTKATEGNYFVDPSCDPLVQQAINLGKKWGVFHFSTNRITDPITEANYFVQNIGGYIGHGILILDNESYTWQDGTWANDPTNVAWAKAWLDQVFALTGVKPLIYMSLAVINAADWSPVINAGYGLICADYVDNATPITEFGMDVNRDPNPRWDGVVGDVMWQFTSTGRLSGYGGNLDCNFFYGDAAAWDSYAGIHADAPAAPIPAPVPEPVESPVTIPPVIVPAPEPVEPTPDPVPSAPADPTIDPMPIDPPVTIPPVNNQTPDDPITRVLNKIVSYIIEFVKRLIRKSN